MRDEIKDRLYFESYVTRKQRMFAKRDDFINNHSADFTKRLGIAYDNFREHAHHTIAIYSMGGSIEDVRSAAIDAIDALDVFTHRR